jgi:acetyl esterase
LQWCFSPPAYKELGVTIDPTRVAILGNSAGGNLAAALSLLISFTSGPCAKFREDLPREFRQVAQVLLYPSLACNELYRVRFNSADEETRAASLPVWLAEVMEACYLPPGVDKEQIFVAPLLARSELVVELRENIAPVLCYVAGRDCLKIETIRYCRKLEAAGVKVETKQFVEAVHGFSHLKEGDGSFRKSDVEDCWEGIVNYLREAFKNEEFKI